MTVTKEAMVGADIPAATAELEQINRFSKTPLTKEQVYIFGVRLCDNQVDRDDEYFDRAALKKLAALFIGKTGIFDHAWSAKNQTARIYRTELVPEAGVIPESGEPGCYLKGFAYMLRTQANADLIAEIEAGIKKEVSIGCAVSRSICSICGNDINDRSRCSHVKGRIYEGKRCVARLEEPTDAFEWSFVAVPAQIHAGVVKAMKGGHVSLGQLVAQLPQDGDWQEAFKRLEREAACGRNYLANLRKETVRLGLMAADMDAAVLRSIVEKLDESELEQLKESYTSRLAKRFPTPTQLRYGETPQNTDSSNNMFVI